MTDTFLRAIKSDLAQQHTEWKDFLSRQLDSEKRTAEEHRHATGVSVLNSDDAAIAFWLNSVVRPNAFVTMVLPFTQTERAPEFYVSLWTRQAEASLWGRAALHRTDYRDRCLWLGVNERIRQDTRGGGPDASTLNHFHLLLRMPRFAFHGLRSRAHPMRDEQRTGRALTLPQRCERMQEALTDASKRTPAPYATSSNDALRGADILVKPYHSQHANYLFKQLQPRFREHWTERNPDGRLLRDHGLFVLPHLPRKHTKGQP